MQGFLEEYSWLIILGIILLFTTLTSLFYYKLDKYEPEPLSRVLFAFFLGIVSIVPTIILELIAVILLTVNSEFAVAVLVAPIVEETCKAAFVLHLAKDKSFDGPLDGLIYGAMVGAGFAAGENLLYGLNFLSEGGLQFGVTLTLVRSVSQIIGHPLYTGIIGAGIGEAKVGLHNRKYIGAWRGMVLHAMWNSTGALPGYGVYFGIFVVVVTSIVVLRNEFKLAMKLDKYAFDTGYYDRKNLAVQYRQPAAQPTSSSRQNQEFN